MYGWKAGSALRRPGSCADPSVTLGMTEIGKRVTRHGTFSTPRFVGVLGKNTWSPTGTYEEPPFALIERTAAYQAMKNLAMKRADITESVNLLDALREVFKCMGDWDGVSDPWLQRRATMPDIAAVEAYKSALYTFKMRWRG